jgi:hypothetical protein
LLIRPDLGAACLVAVAVIALDDDWHSNGLRMPRAWLPLGVGCAIAVAVWAVALLALRGGGGLLRALSVVPEMVFGTVSALSLAPPTFEWNAPFTPTSAHALALRLLPAVTLFAAAYGWRLGRHADGRLAAQGRALFRIGILGLVAFQSAMYRADIHHLWQGIWPLTLAVPAIVAVRVSLASSRAPGVSGAERFLVLVAAALALAGTISLLPILRQPHFDLAPYGRPLFSGLAELSNGASAAPDHPYAQLVASIQRWSAPTDEVFDLVYGPQLLFFAQRPTHGPTVAFQRGLFDSPAWRRERIAELQRHPPALVIVPMAFGQLGPDDELPSALPEIYEFVRAHYPRVVDRRGRYLVLAADGGSEQTTISGKSRSSSPNKSLPRTTFSAAAYPSELESVVHEVQCPHSVQRRGCLQGLQRSPRRPRLRSARQIQPERAVHPPHALVIPSPAVQPWPVVALPEAPPRSLLEHTLERPRALGPSPRDLSAGDTRPSATIRPPGMRGGLGARAPPPESPSLGASRTALQFPLQHALDRRSPAPDPHTSASASRSPPPAPSSGEAPTASLPRTSIANWKYVARLIPWRLVNAATSTPASPFRPLHRVQRQFFSVAKAGLESELPDQRPVLSAGEPKTLRLD